LRDAIAGFAIAGRNSSDIVLRTAVSHNETSYEAFCPDDQPAIKKRRTSRRARPQAE
jgi:hypothetical protein